MTETADTHERTSRGLHAARCCTVTPPVLHWDERIKAIVCSQCNRIYAPIVLNTHQVDRDAVIRALVLGKGIKLRAAVHLGVNRHAMRRRVIKHQADGDANQLVVPYASPGPMARDVAG